MSIKPGARTSPSALISRRALPETLPISTIFPSLTASPPPYTGVPTPSQICAFLMSRSYAMVCLLFDFQKDSPCPTLSLPCSTLLVWAEEHTVLERSTAARGRKQRCRMKHCWQRPSICVAIRRTRSTPIWPAPWEPAHTPGSWSSTTCRAGTRRQRKSPANSPITAMPPYRPTCTIARAKTRLRRTAPVCGPQAVCRTTAASGTYRAR